MNDDMYNSSFIKKPIAPEEEVYYIDCQKGALTILNNDFEFVKSADLPLSEGRCNKSRKILVYNVNKH